MAPYECYVSIIKGFSRAMQSAIFYPVEFLDGPMFYGTSAVPSALSTFWFAHLVR